MIARQSLKMVFGKEFSFPHIRLIYPTSPVRPYTLAGGFPQHVWFDRYDIENFLKCFIVIVFAVDIQHKSYGLFWHTLS